VCRRQCQCLGSEGRGGKHIGLVAEWCIILEGLRWGVKMKNKMVLKENLWTWKKMCHVRKVTSHVVVGGGWG